MKEGQGRKCLSLRLPRLVLQKPCPGQSVAMRESSGLDSFWVYRLWELQEGRNYACGGFAQGKMRNQVCKSIDGPAAPGRLRRVTVGPILGGPPLGQPFGAGSKSKNLGDIPCWG